MSSGTPTPILGLNTFTDSDAFLESEVDANSSTIDTLPATVCTSTTRPTTKLYQSRLIYETDTKRIMYYDKQGTPGWRFLSARSMPAAVRGYIINVAKNVTSTTAWGQTLTSDIPKSITLPLDCMCQIAFRAQVSGVSGTAVSAKLTWSGATTGDQWVQLNSAVLGSVASTTAGFRDLVISSAMLSAGTTTFQVVAYRQNTTNAVTVDAASVVITPLQWGDAYVAGAD